MKSLGLNTEQQARLDPILQESRQQIMALRGQELPEAERQARVQKIREAARVKIREILTPEQRAKYDEATGGGPGTTGRVWVVGPDGKPRAVTLALGITDGTATEVVRGDLAEGQDVIVGMSGGATSGRQPAPTGPRMRL